MDLQIYGDDSKGLIRLDPRTKLLIFFASAIMSLNTFSNVTVLVYSLTLCAILALCGKPWEALKATSLLLVLLYVRGVVYASEGGSPALAILVSAVTTLGLYFFPIVVSFLLLIQTTRISQFLAAFQAMHLPLGAIIPVAVLFRFLPTVQDEWTGIRKAMAFRGISLSPAGILKAPMKTLEYILIPLLFSCVTVMEELAAAALARGLDAQNQRTSYEEVKLHFYDYLVILLFIGMVFFILISTKITLGGSL